MATNAIVTCGLDELVASFVSYTHGALVSVVDSTFSGNNATAAGLAAGGGLFGGPGGAFTFVGNTFTSNYAASFGGGLGLGGGSGVLPATCALNLMEGNELSGNSAGFGASQLYMDCRADMLVSGSVISMDVGLSQVG